MNGYFIQIDRTIQWLSRQLVSFLLLILVVVVLYSVMMRYVFNAPPFWSDRVGVFANMAMVLFGLGITVRNRELIAMQGLYEKISPVLALALETFWTFVILIFALMFTWYGAETAATMPGQYWDFQDFCIDMSLVQAETVGWIMHVIAFIESGVGALIKPFCVNGAVPQKYLAMLMPASGVLISISSLAVLIEDVRKFKKNADVSENIS